MPRRLAACVFGLMVFAACKRSAPTGDDGAPRKAEEAGEASASGSSEPARIGFSDPGNAGIFAYAKREGILERELAKVNARIEWIPAAGAFSANFEAMNSGVMNAAGGAVSPIIGALAHNLKFRIYAIADPSGIGRAGVIVPHASSIRKVSDLVGKRVAVNLAAHGDYILLKALVKGEVPAEKVERLPIQPPDAAAAFATGKIDAWSTFGVWFSTALRNGAHVVALEKDLDSDDVGVLSASTQVLEQNPAAFRTILRVSQDLIAQAHENPEKFQNVFTDKGPTAVSGEELRIAIEETRVAPAFRIPSEHDRTRIRNVSRIFYVNKSIDREIPVEEIVYDLGAVEETSSR